MNPEAFLNLANSILQLVNKIVDSQPPEVQKQMWEWYVEDINWWRKHLGIDKQLCGWE